MARKVSLFVLLALFAGGCSSMKPGSMSDVQTISSDAHAGNVYLLRGFIGIFSTGIDHLGEEINAQGVRANVYQDDQWRSLADEICRKYQGKNDSPSREPLVLIGHSYGADDVVNIARKVAEKNVRVDLLVTIDPTTPPSVPPNVVHTVDLYRPNGFLDTLPFFRGIPLKADPGGGKLENVNIRTDPRDLMDSDTDHFNIEKKAKIHRVVIDEVLKTCPDRQQWESLGHSIANDNSVTLSMDHPAAMTTSGLGAR